jgi:opacity protein-like surface antigen
MKDANRARAAAAAAVAFVCLAMTGVAAAQTFGSPAAGDRARTWDIYGGLRFQQSESVSFDGGSKVDVDSGVGFTFGGGYNLSDKLLVGGELSWGRVDYDGSVASGDDPPGDPLRIDGEFDTFGLNAYATWHFLSGPLTPYVTGNLGYSWVDTNIATGPPVTGCWWDPWFGYICDTFVDTKTENGFSYGLGAGLRWEFTRGWFGRLGYDLRWVDLSSSTSGTPSFGSVRIDIGSRF